MSFDDPKHSEVLISFNKVESKAEKEKKKRAPKIPRYQQYR